MHPELTLISNMYQCDATIERLKAEYEALVATTERGTKLQAETEKQLTQLKSVFDAQRQHERARSRELEENQQRRDRTRAMIDGGAAPDYAAAERQLSKTIEIIDGIETELLEIMEAQDLRRAEIAAVEKTLAKAIADREQASAHRHQREPRLRAEMAETLPKRDIAWKEFPEHWRSHYQELRRKKRPALANVDNEICAVCDTKVPAQRVIEVRMLRAVHFCPGCGAFLLP